MSDNTTMDHCPYSRIEDEKPNRCPYRVVIDDGERITTHQCDFDEGHHEGSPFAKHHQHRYHPDYLFTWWAHPGDYELKATPYVTEEVRSRER